MLFADLNLSSVILEAVKAEGYTEATPIQAEAIPHVLAGKDVLGCAQTGTGKTAAFAMPILHRLSAKSHDEHGSPAPAAHPSASYGKRPRCLVLCPTRELASQIADSFRTYGRGLHLKNVTIFGGVGQRPQVDALHRGVDIVIATPGRLMDLMQQRFVDLSGIEVLVLDEADRMLDMGFIQPIRRIVSACPANRQTLLFSATMAPEIRKLADSLLRQPAVVNIAPVAKTSAQIEETVYKIDKTLKADLLAHLVGSLPMYRTIVFTKTKHGADKVVRRLHIRGIKAEAIHGNKSQNSRQKALYNFSSNKVPVLVATDIASRGIDVDGITHVVNYDITHEPETYVHRIGRTGRANATGAAISFCDRDEFKNLRAIERLIRRDIKVMPNPLPAIPAGTIAPVGDEAFGDHDDRDNDRDDAPRDRQNDRESAHDTRGNREGSNDRQPSRHTHDPRNDRAHAQRGPHKADLRAPNRGYRGDPQPAGAAPRGDANGNHPRNDGHRPPQAGGFSRGNGGNGHRPFQRDDRPGRPASGQHPIGRGAGKPAMIDRPQHPIGGLAKKPKVSTHRKGPRRPQGSNSR